MSLKLNVVSKHMDYTRIYPLPSLPLLHVLHLELPFTEVNEQRVNDPDRREMFTSTLGIRAFLERLTGNGKLGLASEPDEPSYPFPSLQTIRIFAPSYIYILARILQQHNISESTATSDLADLDMDGWDILDRRILLDEKFAACKEVIFEIDPKLLHSLNNGTGEEEDHEPSRLGSGFVQVDLDLDSVASFGHRDGNGIQGMKLVTGHSRGSARRKGSKAIVKPVTRTVNVAEKLFVQLQGLLVKWLPRCTGRGVKVRCAYRERESGRLGGSRA
ncbi:hypothetical protein D9758_008264 [Tetrapyrgos nigripes]|uniref:Uncharacterized protein n=1 Tax=Tetrapyrgos nigripes TaxID=182062 RepID=A0A8H5G1C4_9AGAR|nr:hypothetical protein D9758_008264 [Tetrapyrgos nigripes]